MNIVIDNNVVIDALKPNPIFESAAKSVFHFIADDKVAAFICANSLTDIFYIMKKVQGTEKAKNTIENLIKVMRVISLTEDDCINALKLTIPDFEDAIIAVCAQKINADYIVSRDEKFIKAETAVKAVTPEQLISVINETL